MNYEVGAMAVATVRGVPSVRVIRRETGWASGEEINSCVFHPDRKREVTDIRPLVVLDPGDREAAALLTSRYEDGLNALAGAAAVADFPNGDVTVMQEALSSLVKPPKPEEPTGLGAVVEDLRGCKFVRTDLGDGNYNSVWENSGRWFTWVRSAP